MRDIKWIFVHTAAADIDNVDARMIDDWHRGKGWKGIGYNYVIINDRHKSLEDGEVQVGRDEDEIPAQVYGANEWSIGICCVGHGDRADFTKAQKKSLTKLVVKLCKKYGVTADNVFGHREVNQLVKQGKLGDHCRTDKSCPGNKVDMDEIRGLILAQSKGAASPSVADSGASIAELAGALALIDRSADRLGNAKTEWKNFYYSGEIRGIVEQGDRV